MRLSPSAHWLDHLEFVVLVPNAALADSHLQRIKPSVHRRLIFQPRMMPKPRLHSATTSGRSWT